MSEPVPEGWKATTLGGAATLIMGQSPASSSYNDSGAGLPFFQGKADFGTKHPVVRAWCTEPTKIAPEKSILFSVRAPVGDVNLANTECCIGRGLAGIIGNTIDQSYLYQSLIFRKGDFQLVAQGSTFEAVNGSEMKEFSLLEPPLPEQKKIASILTSVDEVIEKTASQIAKLQDLKTGMMQELLTKGIGHTEFKGSPVGRIPVEWDVVDISEATKVIDCKHATPKYFDEGYPVVKPGNIQEGMINLSGCSLTDKEGFDNLNENHKPVVGDIIYSRNQTYGIGAYVDRDIEFCIGQDVCIIHPVSSDPLFTYYAVNSPTVKNQVEALSAGSTFKRINLGAIRKLLLPLPTEEEQQSIASALASVDRRIEEQKNKKHKFVDVKKALMQDLLTGKVRVKTD